MAAKETTWYINKVWKHKAFTKSPNITSQVCACQFMTNSKTSRHFRRKINWTWVAMHVYRDFTEAVINPSRTKTSWKIHRTTHIAKGVVLAKENLYCSEARSLGSSVLRTSTKQTNLVLVVYFHKQSLEVERDLNPSFWKSKAVILTLLLTLRHTNHAEVIINY